MVQDYFERHGFSRVEGTGAFWEKNLAACAVRCPEWISMEPLRETAGAERK